MDQRAISPITLVVEPGQEQPHLGVVLCSHRPLEGLECLGRSAAVDRGDAGGLEQRGIVRQGFEALAEEQQRLVGPALTKDVPSPALEAASHVLTPHRALRIIGGGATEPLAGAGKLTGGVELQRGLALSAGHRHRGGGDVTAIAEGCGRPRDPTQEQCADEERARRDDQPAGSRPPHGLLTPRARSGRVAVRTPRAARSRRGSSRCARRPSIRSRSSASSLR